MAASFHVKLNTVLSKEWMNAILTVTTFFQRDYFKGCMVEIRVVELVDCP